MDVIDQIKKLAGEGVDLVLQKMDTKRVGAEAERRGLFAAWMRNASNATLAGLLRERKWLCASLTDDELKNAFAYRNLRDETSYDAGKDETLALCNAQAEVERERVKVLFRGMVTKMAATLNDAEAALKCPY